MGWGTTSDLSAPPADSHCATFEDSGSESSASGRLDASLPWWLSNVEVPRDQARDGTQERSQRQTAAPDVPLDHCLFCEFFAGSAVLSAAVSAAGVPVRPADDVATGGSDLRWKASVDELKAELAERSASGTRLMIHVAPPCSTFSRARDRGSRTRLRSLDFPQGFPDRQHAVEEANVIARHALDLVEYVVRDLGGAASLEHPRSSYLWHFLDFDPALHFEDVTFTACMFGASFMKPTMLRCWGSVPSELLGKRCTLRAGRCTCGRTQAKPHDVLEFGAVATHLAAEYVPSL